jgi:hypothetical protein
MLKNMSSLNLTRLFAKIVSPDTALTPAVRRLGEHVMYASTGMPEHKPRSTP